MRYVDASVILGVLFGEERIQSVQLGEDVIVSSVIIDVEAHRAIERERLLGHMNDSESALKLKELSDVLSVIDLVPVDTSVVRLARSAFGVNVRALDALHVATAQVISEESGDEPLVFWTFDERQATAARARGLDVLGA